MGHLRSIGLSIIFCFVISCGVIAQVLFCFRRFYKCGRKQKYLIRICIHYLLFSVIATFTNSLLVSAAGISNTTCISDQLDWYTEWVGETPCATYQRLRQICDQSYEVGPYNASASSQDGRDSCETSQVKDCCCNSISFGLSNLCFNCLYSDVVLNPNGFDSNPGTSTYFYQSCFSTINATLPAELQAAVCTEQIDIIPTLYTLWWGDGSFYYEYFSGRAGEDKDASPGKNLTNCAQTSSSPAAFTPTGTTGTASTSTSTTTGGSANKNQDIGAIAGGVVGGFFGGMFVVVLASFALRYWRRRRGPETVVDSSGTGAIQPYLIPQAEAANRHSIPNVCQIEPLRSTTESPAPVVHDQVEGTSSRASYRANTISSKNTQPPPYEN